MSFSAPTAPVAQLERDTKELRALLASRGWQIVREAIQADILAAAYAMAEKADMPEAEMHFRRGSIHAARGFVSAVENLLRMTEDAYLVAQAEEQAANTLTTPLTP
jgi:hypothetical protein